MVEAQYILYTLTRPLTLESFRLDGVDASQAFVINRGIHLILIEIRTRDLFVILAFDTMSRNQLNQKVKLMIETQYMLCTLINIYAEFKVNYLL